MKLAVQTGSAHVFSRIALLALPLASSWALSATITINSAADTTANDGVCTLREAIIAAQTNTASGALAGECAAGSPGPTVDAIVFNIPGAGVHTIHPTTRLMAKTPVGEPLTINGYTQPGATANTLPVGDNAVLQIEIDGTSMGAGEPLFVFGDFPVPGGNTTIRGLMINRVPGIPFLIGAGFVGNSNGNTVAGNFIGTDATGTLLLDGGVGTLIQIEGTASSTNLIGGTTPADRNVLVGGGGGGSSRILIQGPSNVVQGNYMGTNAAGTAAILAAGRPVNGIGLNGGAAANNLIGGAVAGAGNVIVADAAGIDLNTAQNTTIQGNLIGTNATGTAALGGGGGTSGILTRNAPSGTVVGGPMPAGQGNVISGFQTGIAVGDGPVTINVKGNKIGTDITGALPIPNTGNGIFITTTGLGTIGGDASIGEGNIIAFNGGVGVAVANAPTITDWTIVGNSIFANGALGISLSGGVGPPTPNDVGDADTGANGLQNYPVLTSAAIAAGNVTISGTFNSQPLKIYALELFSNTACDPSGFGEGQTWLDQFIVSTDASGNAVFGPLSFPVPPGQTFFTMTATTTQPTTLSGGGTSEFSACFAAAGALPTLSINNVTANEGNSGTTPFVFTVTLSAVSASTVTVNYATADGTANAGSDYVATSGTLTFNPGVTTQPITVSVNGDTTVEPNETFSVTLSAPANASIATGTGTGTIVNDDAPPLPTLSINNVSANEGNSGTTPFVFTVTLSAVSASTVTVNYATADGTANAGSDYVATSGTLTFNPGVTTQTITVNVNGDTTVEPNETFSVTLSAPANATIATGTGTGTIVNDDAAVPTLSINNVSANEGNSGTTPFVFTVTLSAASASTVTVNYATADGTANAGSDYVATSGTLTFTPGTTTQTITVNVNGDTTVEANETFVVTLSGPSNAIIATASGTGTITNDDAPTPPAVTVIPTLSEWTLIVLAALLLVSAMTRLRRRAG